MIPRRHLKHVRETLTVFIVFCLLSWPLSGHADEPQPADVAATLVGFMGDVEVFDPSLLEPEQNPERDWTDTDGWIKVEEHMVGLMSLTVEQRIRTHKNARARIRFNDIRDIPAPPSGPSVFNIGSNTEMAISQFKVRKGRPEEYRRKGVIDLIRGKIRAFIRGWGQNSDFSVRAGVAVCGIRGTDVTMHYEPERGRFLVEVHEGKVVVSTPHGSRILCAPTRGITCSEKWDRSAMFIDGKFSGGPS